MTGSHAGHAAHTGHRTHNFQHSAQVQLGSTPTTRTLCCASQCQSRPLVTPCSAARARTSVQDVPGSVASNALAISPTHADTLLPGPSGAKQCDQQTWPPRPLPLCHAASVSRFLARLASLAPGGGGTCAGAWPPHPRLRSLPAKCRRMLGVKSKKKPPTPGASGLAAGRPAAGQRPRARLRSARSTAAGSLSW